MLERIVCRCVVGLLNALARRSVGQPAASLQHYHAWPVCGVVLAAHGLCSSSSIGHTHGW